MVIIKLGNLLEAEENILVHQVNSDGIMSAGVAKQIADKFPKVKEEYIRLCDKYLYDYEQLRGKVDLTQENGKYIANIFSQTKDFYTDYAAMKIALTTIRDYAEQEQLTVAMPYKIGCGIANGDFNIVLDIISRVFKNYEVILYKLES